MGKLSKCPTSKPHLQAQAECPCWKYKKTDTHRAERFSLVEAKRLEVSKETNLGESRWRRAGREMVKGKKGASKAGS